MLPAAICARISQSSAVVTPQTSAMSLEADAVSMSQHIRKLQAAKRKLQKQAVHGRSHARQREDEITKGCAAVFCQTSPDEELPRRWWRQETGTNNDDGWPRVRGQMYAYIEGLADGDLVALTQEYKGLPARVGQRLQQFMTESCTVQWIEERNIHAGIAPSGRQVMQRLVSSEALESRPDCASRLPQNRAGRKKYLQRFRRRWGLCIGKFQSREHIEPSVLRRKAAGGKSGPAMRVCPKWGTVGQSRGPKPGAAWWRLFWGRGTAWGPNMGHGVHLVSGAGFRTKGRIQLGLVEFL